MTSAHLKVSFAGPLVSIQDGGRFGRMRYGVPASGPMDRSAFAAANLSLARPQDAVGIEVSLGGLIVECVSGAVTFAVAGGGFDVTYADARLPSWVVRTLSAGKKLTIRAGGWGSWTYLAFAGNLDAKEWLGHAATYSMSGHGGGMLRAGDELEITDAEVLDSRVGDIPCPAFARPKDAVQVVIGPQEHRFEAQSLDAFVSQRYRLTDAFDRMGVRLAGATLALGDALSIPSEPILRGAVQVSGDGVPTILLADHQTTGGYPKIATLLADEVDRLVQHRASASIHFVAVTPAQAIDSARAVAAEKQSYFMELAKPKATLEERLMRSNLIDGVVSGSEDD